MEVERPASRARSRSHSRSRRSSSKSSRSSRSSSSRSSRDGRGRRRRKHRRRRSSSTSRSPSSRSPSPPSKSRRQRQVRPALAPVKQVNNPSGEVNQLGEVLDDDLIAAAQHQERVNSSELNSQAALSLLEEEETVDARPPPATPDEALSRAKDDRGSLLAVQTQEWAQKYKSGLRMVGVQRSAFKARYRASGVVMLDRAPIKDDIFEKGAWGIARAKNRSGKISVDSSAFKVLNDEVCKLHGAIADLSRLPYQMADVLHVQIEQGIDALTVDQLKATHTDCVNTFSWTALAQSDLNRQLTAVRRFVALMPHLEADGAAEIRAIFEELRAEGIAPRARHELGNYDDTESAVPLLFGRSLIKKLKRRFKERDKNNSNLGAVVSQRQRQQQSNQHSNRQQGFFQRSNKSAPAFPRQALSLDGRRNFRNWKNNNDNNAASSSGTNFRRNQGQNRQAKQPRGGGPRK